MLWITLHLRLVRSQERTALDRIRQQSESTLSRSLIISSVCLSDLFSSLFVHCLGLSFPHLLRSFFLSTRRACSLFTLAFSSRLVFLYFCLFWSFPFFYFLCVYFNKSSVTNLIDLLFVWIFYLVCVNRLLWNIFLHVRERGKSLRAVCGLSASCDWSGHISLSPPLIHVLWCPNQQPTQWCHKHPDSCWVLEIQECNDRCDKFISCHLNWMCHMPRILNYDRVRNLLNCDSEKLNTRNRLFKVVQPVLRQNITSLFWLINS